MVCFIVRNDCAEQLRPSFGRLRRPRDYESNGSCAKVILPCVALTVARALARALAVAIAIAVARAEILPPPPESRAVAKSLANGLALAYGFAHTLCAEHDAEPAPPPSESCRSESRREHARGDRD